MISAPLFRCCKLFRYAVFPCLVGFAVLPAGCFYGPPHYGPPPYYHYHPDLYDYYYYPRAQVYFNFTTGTYYYLNGGVWITARTLPPHIHLDVANRVRIRVESDRPYLKFDEHRRIYKPEPDYHMDLENSRREKEANQRWYQDYKKAYPKSGKRRDGAY